MIDIYGRYLKRTTVNKTIIKAHNTKQWHVAYNLFEQNVQVSAS